MKKLGIAAIALFVGSLIYVSCRSETLTMFIWIEQIGLDSFADSLRNCTRWILIYIPNWCLFSLPDALWLFSGILVFDSIWGVKGNMSKLFWISLFLIIAFSVEIGQRFRVLPGTFDWQDMVLMVLACFCAFLVIAYEKREKRREKHDSSESNATWNLGARSSFSTSSCIR